MTSQVEQRLAEHGITLPPAPQPVAAYIPAVLTGRLAITSGQLPVIGKDVVFQGKVGGHLEVEDGARAARICALNALAQLKALLGNLDRITRIVRLEGYVQSADGFSSQPLVMNGASELMQLAFGEIGRHTRIAVGVNELPLNAAVEVAIWAEVGE